MNKKLLLATLSFGLLAALPQKSAAWQLSFGRGGAAGGLKAPSAFSGGTFNVVSIGTKGDDAEGPGTYGVVTIARSGAISGTLYSYAYPDDEMTLTGVLNTSTGVGTVIFGGETVIIKVKTTTKLYTFLEVDYTFTDATPESGGKMYGVNK